MRMRSDDQTPAVDHVRELSTIPTQTLTQNLSLNKRRRLARRFFTSSSCRLWRFVAQLLVNAAPRGPIIRSGQEIGFINRFVF
jgi:hypothetical protein